MEKSNSKNGIVIVILVVIILALGGYLVYDKVIKKDEKKVENTEKKENTTKEIENNDISDGDLDINSEFVQGLYINFYGDDLGNWYYRDETKGKDLFKNNKVSVSDLSQKTKNYVGFRILSQSDIHNDTCTKEKYSDISKYLSQNGFQCGEATEVSGMFGGDTKVIYENVLMNKVESIFGDNSYQKTDYIGVSSWGNQNDYAYKKYVYSNLSNNPVYVYISTEGGNGVNAIGETKLVSAVKKGKTISLNLHIKKVFGKEVQAENDLKINYKKSGNNYYFDSIELVK